MTKVIQLVGQSAGFIVDLPHAVAQACASNGTACWPHEAEKLRIKGVRIDVEKAKTAEVGEDVRLKDEPAQAVTAQDASSDANDAPKFWESWPVLEDLDLDKFDVLTVRSDVGEDETVTHYLMGEWPSEIVISIEALTAALANEDIIEAQGSVLIFSVSNGVGVYRVLGVDSAPEAGVVALSFVTGHLLEPDEDDNDADTQDDDKGSGEELDIPEKWKNSAKAKRMAWAARILGEDPKDIEAADTAIDAYLKKAAEGDAK